VTVTLPPVRITVLGKSPAYQDTDGACSGYLVEQDGRAVVLDMGNGVFGKLRLARDWTGVEAVVISHMHADHFLDLVPYAYALLYAPRQQAEPLGRWPGTDAPARPRLLVPPGGTQALRRVVGAWGSEDLVEHAFALEEYGPGDELEVAGLGLRFQAVPHFHPTTFAIEVTSAEGRRFTYGADHRPNDELVEFARGADLLMLEATLLHPEADGPRGHMTASEAGDHAARAEVGRLIITHLSDDLEADAARAQAESAFGGPVTVAEAGAVYEV
jgi:ribonuclease BN (tRNA processing enzyme)